MANCSPDHARVLSILFMEKAISRSCDHRHSGVLVGNEVCDILKNWLMMPRPSVELLDAHFRVNKLTSFGTASAHSANMMAVATAFLYYWRRAGYVWLVIAVLTGLSRIYVGVHYPYQVLFGWAVGAVVSLAMIAVWEGCKKNRGVPQDEELHEELPENPAV